MVGTVLNNTYRLESALTKGGMGQVFVASHLRVSGRRYAIKQLHPELAVAPNFQARFQREAEAMMKLEHSNIVRIEDFLIEGSTYYLVMEFVEGNDLAHLLEKETRLEVTEAHRLTLELLAGLDYCHNKGLVHRDLKPSNLLLDSEKKLKITDFGIALEESIDQRLTNTGTILGTPDYMSPEQIVGKPLDGRSDIYAVGAILYEMLLGRPLFPRGEEEQGSYVVLFAHVHKPPPPIKDGSIPEYLRVVIEKSLQKEPENRYQSAKEMALAMNELAGSAYSISTGSRKVWPYDHSAPTTNAPAAASGSSNTALFERSSAVSILTTEPSPPALASDQALERYQQNGGPLSPGPASSRSMTWILLLVILLGLGAGVWLWEPSRSTLLAWFDQVMSELPPEAKEKRRTPPRRAAPKKTIGKPPAPQVSDAGGGDTDTPQEKDTKETENGEEPSLSPSLGTPDSVRKPSQRRERPDLESTPKWRTPPRARNLGGFPEKRWPVPVTQRCAKLLTICVGQCMKRRDQPTLAYAIECRRNCWKMRRLFKLRGESICPQYDGGVR